VGLAPAVLEITLSNDKGEKIPLGLRCGLSGLYSSMKWPDDYRIQILPGHAYEMPVGLCREIPSDGLYTVTFRYIYDSKAETIKKDPAIQYPADLWTGIAEAPPRRSISPRCRDLRRITRLLRITSSEPFESLPKPIAESEVPTSGFPRAARTFFAKIKLGRRDWRSAGNEESGAPDALIPRLSRPLLRDNLMPRNSWSESRSNGANAADGRASAGIGSA